MTTPRSLYTRSYFSPKSPLSSHDKAAEFLDDPDECFKQLTEDMVSRFRSLLQSSLPCSDRLPRSDYHFISTLIYEINKQSNNNLDQSNIKSTLLWDKLIVLCSKHVVNNPEIDLLRRAMLEWNENLKQWPTTTLGQLVNAQQKREFLDHYLEKEKERFERKYGKNPTDKTLKLRLEAYKQLILQIKDSDSGTTLSEIFRRNSLYLKVVIDKDKKTGKVDTIESVLNAHSKKTLNEIRDKLAEVNPYTVLAVANTHCFAPKDDDDYARKNKLIYERLADCLETYERNHKRTHHIKFKKLCDDVMFLMWYSKDHEKNHRLILNRIKESLAKEERDFRKPFFFGKEKSKADFEKKLNKNNDKYTYPRRLRDILRDAEEFDPSNLPQDTFIALLPSNTNPFNQGKRIPKGTALRGRGDEKKRKYYIYTKLSRSVDVGENKFYLVPGKNKGLIREGTTYQKIKRALGVEIQKESKDNKAKVVISSCIKYSVLEGEDLPTVQRRMKEIKQCVPNVQLSRLFTKKVTQKGVKKHNYWFFIENIGGVTLKDIVTGKINIKLTGEDICGILTNLLDQTYFASLNQCAIRDIRLETIIYDIQPGYNHDLKQKILRKKATIVSHVYDKLTDHPDDKQTVYEIGLIMAELIMGNRYRNLKQDFQANKKNYIFDTFMLQLDIAAWEMLIPKNIIELIKKMLAAPDKCPELQKVYYANFGAQVIVDSENPSDAEESDAAENVDEREIKTPSPYQVRRLKGY